MFYTNVRQRLLENQDKVEQLSGSSDDEKEGARVSKVQEEENLFDFNDAKTRLSKKSVGRASAAASMFSSNFFDLKKEIADGKSLFPLIDHNMSVKLDTQDLKFEESQIFDQYSSCYKHTVKKLSQITKYKQVWDSIVQTIID